MSTPAIFTPDNACPKCNGSGRVGYRRANGICFRCGGAGFISDPALRAELEAFAAERQARLRAPLPPQAPAPPAPPPAAVDGEDPEAWLLALFTAEDETAQP